MKHRSRTLIPLILMGLSAIGMYSQGINNNLRSFDDNHALAGDTTGPKIYRSIKEVPFTRNGDFHVSFGGEIREQSRYYNHINYGDVEEGEDDSDLFLWQRILLHTDWHFGSQVRFFAQINSTQVFGKNSVWYIDKDLLSFMQAFIEIKPKSLPMSLRIGRQEVSFGLERVWGARDGANTRQSFDGLRYTAHLQHSTGSLFLVYPTTYEVGVFDNSTNTKSLYYAGYWEIRLRENSMLDLYYIGNDRQELCLENDTVNEMRHTAGIRFSRATGSFYYDTEVTWQSGIHGALGIQALHFSALAGYRWDDAFLSPRLQLRGRIYTGDRDSMDNYLNVFRPVTARSPVSDMLPIGPTNLAILNPEGEINLMKGVGLILRYFAVWRIAENDGIYSPDMEHLIREPYPAATGKDMLVTTGFTSELTFTTGSHMNGSLTLGYFIPGDFIKNTGLGKNILPVALKFTYRI